MCPRRELPAVFPVLDVSEPDVQNLVPALDRGPRKARGRVLVYLGGDVEDEERQLHETSPS